MAINASFSAAMSRALPGQVSDTSLYNIDGACVLDEGDILVGVAVQVKSVDELGHKVIKPMADGGVPYGVAIRSHFQTEDKLGNMVYVSGSGVNVMSSGRVWIRTNDESAQAFGSAVKLAVNGYADAGAGNIVTGWTYTGDFTKFGDEKLAEVQLHQL